ncbi:outer membrane protein [Pseudoxanthomonas japonensis]|uniref:OmpW/AlkL family protein n=1 Tax=Pseudoxanthomonas TaxID=83618 RepID=UPI000780F5C9|nr:MULTISPECIES: OmpW family outer membrane protein [Pseudoxanthomonas]MBA3929265.1 OmpW family protein [Xanthomonas sp.]MBL8256661.1 OmpW family protein [Pseudoxanthomonas mexicana]MDR7069651.1 outer membrane protein [Pseudoxanthomonas japonensis]
MKKTLIPIAIALALGAAVPAFAQSKGDWTLGVGIHNVAPKSDNGSLDATALGLGKLPPTEVSNSVRPTITFEYFVARNLGVEVLAALPFEHDISIRGIGKVGSTKQLPPVVSLQYHFTNKSKATPFVGVGLNYTTFFQQDTRGALAGTKLELDNSWGAAAHVGVDFALSERGSLRVDARWADINTDVSVNGIKVGEAEIDPLVYGLAYVMKF